MPLIHLSRQYRKKLALAMLGIMIAELLVPNVAMALSSGPVQPEISSFEPVGTTDMVDLFTGDFVYNIPLMDVEGYPINISYHGGATMEQEASWVGLGWNINPGAVNRSVRGLPDEFNGEVIEKEIKIKPEITKKIGVSAGIELLGYGDPFIKLGANLGGYLTMSNYRGTSVDLSYGISAALNTKITMISAGLNLGATIGSQSGAAIDYSSSVGVGISQAVSKDMSAGGNFNLNYGGVYSPRTSLRQNMGAGISLSMRQNATGTNTSFSTGTSVPIGTQNQTVAITNASYMNSRTGQLKLGGEVWGIFPNGKITGSVTQVDYRPDGSRKGFGYFNLSEATDEDLLDFSREKDGMYNTNMKFLPQSHLTYDVYAVSGQGTGGSFRPFRNDIGSVYDPKTTSVQDQEALTFEAGLGNLFTAGGEFSKTTSKNESGPWEDYKRGFTKKSTTGFYENVYFKEAGELTQNNEAYLDAYANNTALTPSTVNSLPLTKTGADKRITRANHIYTISAADEDTAVLVDGKYIVSYKDTTGFKTFPVVNTDTIPRAEKSLTKRLSRKTNHVTEIVQNQKDGRRYVYGLPVVNNVQREVTFAVEPGSASNTLDPDTYLITYADGVDDSQGNTKGMDNFYSSTVTPTYVTAHLLTGVLSSDYVDVTGNGISDDDLGTYTKFNYARKSADYRWRSPIRSGTAQYMPNSLSDKRDDKASYMIGSREQWMLHSVETKNYVAEFYVSQRNDARGVLDRIIRGGLAGAYDQAPYNAAGDAKDNKSYKLDSIVLYNKNDRFIKGPAAQSIKTVIFGYDYSLCKGIPNATPGSGKLTLQKIQVKYGASNLNMSAAYNFKYSTNNPDYNDAAKDRWGMYKPNNPAMNNFEFPFTTQSAATNDYVNAWSLTEIGLPSGGVIKAEYESDDYAYVQDKEAMEMFKLEGIGSSNSFTNRNMLYFSADNPNLYLYFKRRVDAENSNLSFRENYLNGSNLLYYNIPVELVPGKFEPVKGYAEVVDMGVCPGSDGLYGYIRVAPRTLKGSRALLNPVVLTALNLGRYSLPHILFPGSDPDASDIDNIVTGLKNGIKELFGITKNPLENMIGEGKAQYTNNAKAFVRLTSPGLKKKGGGQRVKAVRFYDSWDAMAGGNQATYGKTYDYTLKRDDGRGYISSGVASYEPMIGSDEIPQHQPAPYIVQRGNEFPPNDPVDLFQEYPLGESFYPGPVVGYSNVVVRSINVDNGRSAQSEDIHGFYTAKDFPVRVEATEVKNVESSYKASLSEIEREQEATQGCSILLNDMHGKQRNTEHWMLKPAAGTGARELLNMQKFEYLTQGGALSNQVPVYNYNAPGGKMTAGTQKMGIETDLTIDSRIRKEESETKNYAANLNTFIPIPFIPAPLVIPWLYPFEYSTKFTFRTATATKITQQYGILSKVISSNQGAVTEVHNEIFDQLSGNAIVTSVNNEFNDREYSVSYPAHWAYKELGPAYQNHEARGLFRNDLVIDTLGKDFADLLKNYNPSFSTRFALPPLMPVARIIIDEEMPKFTLGDEMLLYHGAFPQPVKTWTMGYTSDKNHCYLILATREPYQLSTYWDRGKTYSGVSYRVTRSGNKNRLGETIQSFTTADSSNVFPELKNDLTNLVSLNAQTYKHNLNQVFAANQASDSLNPFLTGKVGLYRPEKQLINLKKRDYSGGTARNAGLFNSKSYWQIEKDVFPAYCPDTSVGSVCGRCDSAYFSGSRSPLFDSMKLVYLGGDSIRATMYGTNGCNFVNEFVQLGNETQVLVTDISPATIPSSSTVVLHADWRTAPVKMRYITNCCCAVFDVQFDGTDFMIQRRDYSYPAGPMPATFTNTYKAGGLVYGGTPGGYIVYPYRIRKKILLGKVGHYDGTDNENWTTTQQVTKYNWFGQELENKEEGIGYNAAVYGHNQQLPVCVAKNAKHAEVLFEGFEDYRMLQGVPDKNASYTPLEYSPFATVFQTLAPLGPLYNVRTLAGTVGVSITSDEAHTGTYALKTNSTMVVSLNAADKMFASGYSFKMAAPRKYMVSLWLKPLSVPGGITGTYTGNVQLLADSVLTYTSPGLITKSLVAKSAIIEGWQKFELVFDAPPKYKNFSLVLGNAFYYDDIRIYPFESNSKGFVYHPVNRKLMATLDENNYATFYEYDAEGNLVRTKKETEKGILTVTESRSTHRKTN